jgi:hypothetical protein
MWDLWSVQCTLGELDYEVREYLKNKGLNGVQNSGAKL